MRSESIVQRLLGRVGQSLVRPLGDAAMPGHGIASPHLIPINVQVRHRKHDKTGSEGVDRARR